MTARCPSAIIISNLQKNKCYIPPLGPNRQVSGRRSFVGQRFLFHWGQGWGPRISWAHTSLVNLKHQVLRGKNQVVSYRNKTKDCPRGWWPDSWIYWSWHCVCLTWLSLKWVSHLSLTRSLSQALGLQKRKQLSKFTLYIVLAYRSFLYSVLFISKHLITVLMIL